MKLAMLLHNPKAGDENHLAQDIQHLIEDSGYECEYYSIKEEGWKKAMDKADLIVVAGGDGSVRTIAKEMITRGDNAKRSPLAILPMGTANNLFRTLGVGKRRKDVMELVRGWNFSDKKSLDIGLIKMGDTEDFFIEGAGFGVFPKLIDAMRHLDKQASSTKDGEVKLALSKLIEIVKTHPINHFQIETKEGQVKEIECFLLEVMNIKSVGPNLYLAPNLSISNGYFDVVYITQAERQRFIVYLQSLLEGQPFVYPFNSIRTSELTIRTKADQMMHVDDELVKKGSAEITFMSKRGFLEFLP
ncbi:diacylglycerol kinase catalytic region [Pseudopedobacter saltans DSM 12145]|uniref:Diacylglycerol kinase catalytic region n=1 Tax=Pseudopedobacter saltans (strain ATCC 51119 / DSM 12145 / JCM 21818 / CCUG 39354 / LMG 10337 / NBRC 100064 / NCIMB 13643) TaxID=762903 RepID=F0S5M1_PSESL|nr:diacylglycerol kinase family protein [Pseudopedobacter saltans]ADY54195.1 diacylglycerol kinase catalytic region [Pseudopedobacter saltans DSM 12145]